jgi:hypothetical protein
MLLAVFAASAAHAVSGITSTPLVAGQHTQAGVVGVYRWDVYIAVEYITNEDWCLEEVHLYVGDCPPTKAAPGQFPYKVENLGGVDQVTIWVPMEDVGLQCWDTVYIAAHAVVTSCACEGEETAWGCGPEIRPGKNWAMYFCGVIPCPFPP